MPGRDFAHIVHGPASCNTLWITVFIAPVQKALQSCWSWEPKEWANPPVAGFWSTAYCLFKSPRSIFWRRIWDSLSWDPLELSPCIESAVPCSKCHTRNSIAMNVTRRWNNVGKTIRNQPFEKGLYHLWKWCWLGDGLWHCTHMMSQPERDIDHFWWFKAPVSTPFWWPFRFSFARLRSWYVHGANL